MRFSAIVLLAALACAATAAPAGAWGAMGHRLINEVAIKTLPATVPAFLRSPAAIAEIRSLGPEADKLKGFDKTFDADMDPGHFIDLDDDGVAAHAFPISALPATREAFNATLATGNEPGRPADRYTIGYLPYNIIDGWNEIVADLAYWRVDDYGATHSALDAMKAIFVRDRALREALTLRDIGYWGHFIADASQPLHASVHYNGWGSGPNPHNYSQSNRIHSKFETAFVNANSSVAQVTLFVRPYVPSQAAIRDRVATYLQGTVSQVETVYVLEGEGALDTPTAASVAFVNQRLAAGAQMMRDLIADGYVAAGEHKVGYPAVSVHDIESGSVPLTPATIGAE